MTLVYRGFLLDAFADAPISGQYLAHMEADFAALRAAGLKAIPRFAYTNRVHTAPGTRWPPVPPYGDAPVERVLEHIAQLAPVLRANADVIAVVQAGFIGIWGEWFYTDAFAGQDLDHPSAEDWDRRRQVVERLLSALPPTRMVQVRTPLQKQQVTGRRSPLTRVEAFGGSLAARIGHHNDCFLASDTDYGTYRDPEAEYDFLEADTRYVPVGGETCNPNPPRSECASALAEMARFHWSYLNSGYHRGVLDSWRIGGCMAQVERRLGYRLSLKAARFAPSARPGGTWRLELELANEGFAAPFLPRRAEVVLRHRVSDRQYRADLGVDLRQLLPGAPHPLGLDLGLPADMEPGRYAASLHLADPDPALAARPEYAVRLANAGVWEPASGHNRLGFDVDVLERAAWLPHGADAVLRESPPPTGTRAR